MIADCAFDAMVNFSGVSIELEEIENFLKKNLQLKEISQKILYQKIINQAAQERNLTVTEAEIQVEADRHRRERRLEKASDTITWLADQMMTPESWEAGIYEKLLSQKLAQSLFSREIDKYFAQNKIKFEQVILYQIIIPYEKLAWEIFYQIEEEEMSFYQAAHFYDIDEKRRLNCGYEGKIYRSNIPPDLAAVIFSIRPKEVTRPIKSEQGYHLLMVEEFIPAQLTPELHQELLEKMFSEWLASELNYFLHHSSNHSKTDQT